MDFGSTFQIKPIKNDAVAVVFSFNNDFCKYFAAALRSLVTCSNPDKFYDIIVFCSDISKQNKYLLSCILKENFNIRFFDVKSYLGSYLGEYNLCGFKCWSVDMYYRLLIPIIMREYEKVLYLDSDVIVKNDVSFLFDKDFEDCEILASRDVFSLLADISSFSEMKDYILNTLKIDNYKDYFNSGVILFNISKIDKENYLERLKVAFALEKTYYPDQDILNFIFKKRVKFIPLNWNMQYHIPLYYDKYFDKFNENEFDNYNKAFENPLIIHYTSPQKPWKKPSLPLAYEFFRAVRQTDFYEEILQVICQNEIFHSRFAQNLYMKLKEDKKFFLWGASLFLEDFSKKYGLSSENVLGIIDIDPSKIGKKINNIEIFSPDVLLNCGFDEIIMTVISRQDVRYFEVRNTLSLLGLKDFKLIKL